ncbi:leucine-rich repeat domain-containing protein [uncultured Duncaniella sp.]|nr:leucine-rich repeat domain-containing protein [uncultured Duncaniella sp.]
MPEPSPIGLTFNVAADPISRAATNAADPDPIRAFMYVSDITTGKVVTLAQQSNLENGLFQFSIELDRNHKYTVAFWADAGDYTIDSAEGLKNIRYTNSSTQTPQIAYTAKLENFTPTESVRNVTLQHAVGKLVVRETSNLNTGDKVTVSFTRTNYRYSAVEDRYTDDSSTTPISHTLTVDNSTNTGDIITLYMLAPNTPNEPVMIVNDFLLSYLPVNESTSHSKSISLVPFQANHRTLIAGNFMGLAKVNQTFSVGLDTNWNSLTPEGDENKSENGTEQDPTPATNPEITLTNTQRLTESMLNETVGSGNALKINGPMKDSDFDVLREWLSTGQGASKRLALDLGSASFTSMPEAAFSTDGLEIFEETAVNPTTGLASIVLPTGLTAIPAGAFIDCVNLHTVTIPSTVTTIEEMAFYRSGITKLDAPSVTVVNGDACEECENLTTVILGNITKIANGAFRKSQNITIMDLTRCTAMPTGNNAPFGNQANAPTNMTVYVATAAIMEAFKNNPMWNGYGFNWVVGTPSL